MKTHPVVAALKALEDIERHANTTADKVLVRVARKGLVWLDESAAKTLGDIGSLVDEYDGDVAGSATSATARQLREGIVRVLTNARARAEKARRPTGFSG